MLMARDAPLVVRFDDGGVKRMRWPDIGDGVPCYLDYESLDRAASEIGLPLATFAHWTPRQIVHVFSDAGSDLHNVRWHRDRLAQPARAAKARGNIFKRQGAPQ